VTDVFRCGRGLIRPVESRFRSFGAGIPDVIEPPLSLEREGEDLVLRGFTAAYQELAYIVGTVSDHLLLIDGEEISLRNLCGKNAHIVISIKNESRGD
jgi:hypothetical protein